MAAIDLAHAHDFTIGDVVIRPSIRSVNGGGGEDTIEPRVMQVLIALAEAGGRVVSRSDLTERCWGGRVVGEDAVNRIIAKVRRVGENAGGGAFRVETITKIGYRLVERMAVIPVGAGPTALPAPAPMPPPRVAWLRRHAPTAAIIALLLAALGGAVFAILPKPRAVATRPPVALVGAAAQDLETRGLSDVFEGTPEQTVRGIEYLRQSTNARPGYALGWGSLAMGYLLSLPLAPEAERAGVAARVREAAARALSLDPHEGRSLAALAGLEPVYGDWARQDARLTAALAVAPRDTPPLLYQRIQFLSYVGRTREALALAERLYASSPFLPWVQATRIDLLAANGRLDAAERAAAHAAELWPRNRELWFARFGVAAFGGKPALALAMTQDRATWPTMTDPAEIARAANLARALGTRAPADVEHALAGYREVAGHDQNSATWAFRAAVALDRHADALSFARRLYLAPLPTGPRAAFMPRNGWVGSGERNTAPLFLPPAEGLFANPDFISLLRDTGLVDYWSRTRSPDFCLKQASAPICARLRSRSIVGSV